MKYKILYLLITISVVLIILKIDVFSNGVSEVKLSTPEETLNTYIDALREGNLNKVLESYYSDLADFRFHLPSPLHIKKYEIVSKKIYTGKMADSYRAIPKVKAGDVEFDVKQYIDDREEMFTYLLRKINQKWRIISHSNWSHPD